MVLRDVLASMEFGCPAASIAAQDFALTLELGDVRLALGLERLLGRRASKDDVFPRAAFRSIVCSPVRWTH